MKILQDSNENQIAEIDCIKWRVKDGEIIGEISFFTVDKIFPVPTDLKILIRNTKDDRVTELKMYSVSIHVIGLVDRFFSYPFSAKKAIKIEHIV